MRKITLLFFLVFLGVFPARLFAQSGSGNNYVQNGYDTSSSARHITPGGWLDTVYDQHGKAYPLTDIAIPDNLRTNKGANPQPLVQCNCNSGYFQLWMEPGCGMDGNSQAEIDRRNVVCQVLRDISSFIPSPLTATGQKVNVLFQNFNLLGAPPGAIGAATSMYIVPPTNYGIADNTVWTTIHTGVDAYQGVTSPLYTANGIYPSNIFFHCLMSFNFSQSWHTDLSTAPNSSELDYYSIVLHEMCHALGIAANINRNGSSIVGNHNPLIKHQYYSRYDKFLTTQAVPGGAPGQHLIHQDTGACGSMYGYLWNTTLDTVTTLSPQCAGGVAPFDTSVCSTAIDYSGTVTMPVYTPGCFFLGSSLSHFEDYCQVPASFPVQPPLSNNLYYVMSNVNGTGPQFMKRYLKPEERTVLCDLGYAVQAHYGDSNNHSYYAYAGSACDGIQVAGVNDGIQVTGPNAGTYINVYTTAALMPAGDTLQNILANDYCATPANLRFECLQPVDPTEGTVNVSSGNGSTIVTYTPSANFGTAHLLRYVPYDTVTGKRGNITYVYVWVNNANCNMMGCVTEMINNPEFTADTCASGIAGGLLNCWSEYATSPDLYYANCTDWSHTIPVPINSTGPSVIYPYNVGNTNFLGIFSSWHVDSGYWTTEAAQTTLSSPMMPGQTYQISFWAKSCDWPYNTAFTSVKIGYSDQTLPPIANPYYITAPLTAIHNLPISNSYGDVHLNPGWNAAGETTWMPYTYTFTFPGTVPASNLIITSGLMDTAGESASVLGIYTRISTYFVIDGLHLMPVSYAANFTLPDTTICLNQTIPDLSLFVSPPSTNGSFSGAGVTYSNGTYSYSSTTAGAGPHTISYTYTDANGCTHVLALPLKVIGNNTGFTVSGSDSLCTGSAAQLHAQGATSYHWYPSGTFCDTCANTYVSSLTATTTFTVVGIDSNCAMVDTFTVHVGTANPPTIPTATYVYCQNTTATPLVATPAVSGAVLHWYTVPVGGIALSGAPTPSTATTGVYHWYVSESLNGCESIRDTITVTVNPAPAAPLPLTVTYCQNAATTQLQPATGNYHWWTSATGNTMLAAAPFPSSAVPGSTTWYLSAYLGGCESARAAQTVNVTAAPAPPVVAGTITYCSGAVATALTPPSGNGIQWYNSANQAIPAPTPNTAVAGTTIYHVTNTVNNCSSAPAYDTVIVTPTVSITITASNGTPCFGATDTLTAVATPAVSGFSYSWSYTATGSGTASITCINPPACSQVVTSQSNSSVITYSVSATNGCSNTASVIIRNAPCDPCDVCSQELDAPYIAQVGGLVNAGVYCLHSDLTISGNVTLQFAEVKISPLTNIIVPAGAHLTLLGSWLHGCSEMWNGIQVQDGGMLTINSGTTDGKAFLYPLIEDAYTAIYYSGTDSGSTSSLVDVRNTTFNRNNIGISLNNYNHVQATYPFSVQNSVFTCRDLSDSGSYQWAAEPDVAAASQPVSSELETKFLNTTTYPSANLKSPMDDEQSSIGIYLGNVGKATVDIVQNPHVTQYYPHAYYGVQIGKNGGNTVGQMENYNLFDGLHNGIIANNSSFICKNNIFQRTLNDYIWNDEDGDYDEYSGLGIGATCDQQEGKFFQMQLISLSTTDPSFSNHFFDCQTAVFNSGYSDLLISRATFRSSKTSPSLALVNSAFNGWKGIQIVNKRFFGITIDHSQLYNIHQPILFTSSANGYQNGRLNILSNCIAANLNGQPVTSQYVSDAITVNHATSTTSGTNSFSYHITINNNTVQNVYRGISVNSWPGKEIAIQNNYIRMVADPVVATQAGINFGVNTALIQSEIQGNMVVGPATNKKPKLTGIYGYGSSKYRVQFNISNGNYNGIQFVGNNTTLKVESNRMATDHYGLVLGGAGGPGTIGMQGSPTYATDNRWTGSFTAKTALLATSSATGNELYIRDSATLTAYNPNGSSYGPLSQNHPYTFGSWHTLRWVSHPQAVAASPFHADGSECGMDELTPMPLDTAKTHVFELERTALGLNIEPGDPDSLEHLKVQQLDLVKFLNNEPEWLDSSYVLYNFYTQMLAGDAGDMTGIEAYLAEEDEANAAAAIDWWLPEDGIGDNYRKYYQLYLDWMEGAWTAEDGERLTELASGCPYTGGSVVLYARAFYTQVYGKVVIFEDNCGFEDDGSGTVQRHTNPVTAAEEPRTIHLYPNPTTGLVNITVPLDETYTVEAMDATGKSVSYEQVNNQAGLISIRLNAAPGIYLVRITNSTTGETVIKKLTLQN